MHIHIWLARCATTSAVPSVVQERQAEAMRGLVPHMLSNPFPLTTCPVATPSARSLHPFTHHTLRMHSATSGGIPTRRTATPTVQSQWQMDRSNGGWLLWSTTTSPSPRGYGMLDESRSRCHSTLSLDRRASLPHHGLTLSQPYASALSVDQRGRARAPTQTESLRC